MTRVFLGKWWHWAIVVAITALLWLAGDRRMHVVEFNTFVLLLLGGAAMVVTAVLAGTRPGEQVTRDRLEPGDRR